MAANPGTDSAATTTEAVAAAAQSRDGTTAPAQAAPPSAAALSIETLPFSLSAAIDRVPVAPHQRRRNEPLYAPLRIYAIDPFAQARRRRSRQSTWTLAPAIGAGRRLFVRRQTANSRWAPRIVADVDDRTC